MSCGTVATNYTRGIWAIVAGIRSGGHEPMTLWEYRVAVIQMYPSIEAAAFLNKAGSDGWELISIHHSPDADGVGWDRAVFKRSVSQGIPAPTIDREGESG